MGRMEKESGTAAFPDALRLVINLGERFWFAEAGVRFSAAASLPSDGLGGGIVVEVA